MRGSTARLIRWSALAAMMGGLLWVPYGIFEMLQPWGTDTVYSDDVGYELITDMWLYRLYNLPGSLALLLTSLALLGVLALLGLAAQRLGRVALILTYVAVALAAASIGGVVALFDPVFTAGRIFGTFALGLAVFLAGVAARKAGRPPGWAALLLVLGVVGGFLLPLWPLVYAVQLLTESAGAAVLGAFGVGWMVLGWVLWARGPAAAASRVRGM